MNSSETEQPGAAQHFAFEAARDAFGSSTDVDSCVALVARINTLMDQASEYFQREGAGIACRAGCAFCCHLRVMVFPHEAIALFRHLGSRLAREQADRVRARVLENAAHVDKQKREGRVPTNMACAFLVDGKCAAYEARPAACSGFHSLSREKCEEAYQNGGSSPEGTPVLQSLRYVAAALDDGVEQALVAAGLSRTRIELHTAVAALIRNPSLISRWRSGRELIKETRR